ncbi:hypothetical protein ROA7450_00753 [Roseovarius albus]|uniref:Uncharacterized protein n=1 Tax=Roseovarius albus TaxID=1247867 RepID=A0A1X6YH62_9RHOB|nr:hypothetical protein ROA7450_00753 [Roseovarius albus]
MTDTWNSTSALDPIERDSDLTALKKFSQPLYKNVFPLLICGCET